MSKHSATRSSNSSWHANKRCVRSRLARTLSVRPVPVATQLPDLPGPVPAGLPSELLERRPDVVAADQRVAAAFYGCRRPKPHACRDCAHGPVTDITSDLFVLQDRDNPVWSVGATCCCRYSPAARSSRQVEIRTSEQKQAIAQYGQVGARAFGEVERCVVRGVRVDSAGSDSGPGGRRELGAADLAQIRYRVGSGDLRVVQQQQIAVHASRTSFVRVQAEQLVQRVNVYLALGGGFDVPPPAVARATNDQSMAWLRSLAGAHPEIAFFIVFGLGYLFGKISLGSFKLGAVTGTLLAGVLVGQLGVTCRTRSSSAFFCCSSLRSDLGRVRNSFVG